MKPGNERVEARTIRKIRRRLVPFLVLCYVAAYLDRVNVGFAALTMNADIGLDALSYSLGASIFFVGYFLFEVPSNYALVKVGARRWIARIMVTWGILSSATAFVSGPTSFYVARFLVGAAEAGFFPGIILYLTFWFPPAYRARIVSLFMVSIPASSVVGAPISGSLLGLDGWLGLKGWQWLFILEGAPAVLLGLVAGWYLTDSPERAEWLSREERDWLRRALRPAGDAESERATASGIARAMASPRILCLAIVYFGLTASNYGLGFWLPQIVKAMGLTNTQTGLVTALPFLSGAIAMVLWARHSDRSKERFWHMALPAALACMGLATCACLRDPWLTVLVLSVAATGIFASLPVFWTLPTAMLTGTRAATGIALINSIANLSGFGGPYLVGWIKQRSGSFDGALLALSIFPLISTALVLVLGWAVRIPAEQEQI
ncbi:MFS transporter [Pendulispora rubella]|uniref:MFS transporter n=1 Tax=Pendulispora rubella TaxID=2741070 RepID=A0ABZ2KT69_9BACT